MLGLKLIYVSKRDPWYLTTTISTKHEYFLERTFYIYDVYV